MLSMGVRPRSGINIKVRLQIAFKVPLWNESAGSTARRLSLALARSREENAPGRGRRMTGPGSRGASSLSR